MCSIYIIPSNNVREVAKMFSQILVASVPFNCNNNNECTHLLQALTQAATSMTSSDSVCSTKPDACPLAIHRSSTTDMSTLSLYRYGTATPFRDEFTSDNIKQRLEKSLQPSVDAIATEEQLWVRLNTVTDQPVLLMVDDL